MDQSKKGKIPAGVIARILLHRSNSNSRFSSNSHHSDIHRRLNSNCHRNLEFYTKADPDCLRSWMKSIASQWHQQSAITALSISNHLRLSAVVISRASARAAAITTTITILIAWLTLWTRRLLPASNNQLLRQYLNRMGDCHSQEDYNHFGHIQLN